MAEFRTRRRVLAAKIETVSGTPETLAAADANNLVYDCKFNPTVEMFERQPYNSSLSAFAGLPGVQMGEITCKVEVKGAGTAGTPPAIGKLLKACGCTETISAGVSVAYSMSSATSLPSLTMGVYMDGIRKRIAGGRGTFRLAGKIGEPVFAEFTFKGLLVGEDDIATLTGTGIETTIPPQLLASTFSVHGFSPKVSAFSIDLNNTLAMRPDIAAASGYAGCLITGRSPKGTMDPEDELVASHPFFTRWKGGTTGALNLVLGATAGNIVTIAAPALQYTNQQEGEREGLATRNVDFALVRSAAAGDDELTVTFT